MITSAFTCTGPYAILILLGIKRVENRRAMPVPAKGRCAVSCSKSFCKEEFGEFVRWAAENLPEEDFARLPSLGDVGPLRHRSSSRSATATTTTVDPGEVFSAALQVGAKAIVVAHNHPSGNLTASEQDKLLTDELARLGEALGVAVLDHLVIGGGSAVTCGRCSRR